MQTEPHESTPSSPCCRSRPPPGSRPRPTVWSRWPSGYANASWPELAPRPPLPRLP